MITLSNGHKFEYMVASGALGFDGKGYLYEWPLRWMGLIDPSLFTIVAKTVTYKPRKGNLRLYKPWACIRFLPNILKPDGVVNSVGLRNKGIKWWCEEKGVLVGKKKISLVGSILSDNIYELVEMAKMMNDFDLVALEINASCTNTGGDLLENTEKVIMGCLAVKEVSRFPLILKVSVVHDVRLIFAGMDDEDIEAISINSVPWETIFPYKKSPLAHLGGGGVSGKIAQPYTWGLVKDLVSLTSIPVIGPSVWDYKDMQELRDIGAKAISFGSVFFRFPWACRPTMYVRKDMKRNRN